MDAEEGRRRREDNIVEIRKNKREESLLKKRLEGLLSQQNQQQPLLSASSVSEKKTLISLKKGAQLLKFGRKGKPKFYPFRLSSDETSLIWISNNGERKNYSQYRILFCQCTYVPHHN